jgi:LmbE family N-acetylglucosaminyl deacetylase
VLSSVKPFGGFDPYKSEPLDIRSLGNVCIFAPHPDDESLGCGGLIALANTVPVNVHLVIVSDGSRSHPRSVRFPPERMRKIRRQEVIEAARILGTMPRDMTLLSYVDTEVPHSQDPAFANFVDVLSACIAGCEAKTVCIPYMSDPHCDHKAVHSAVHTSRKAHFPHVRILEYPIWSETETDRSRKSSRFERVWSLDIHSVLEKKKNAIRCHVSQTGELVDDDPTGFCLDEEMLAKFETPTEYYFEAMDA